MSEQMLTLTGEQLREKHSALSVLANRALIPDAESMVFSLLYLLKPAMDEFNAQAKKIDEDAAKIKDADPTEETLEAAKEVKARQVALFAKTFEVKAPKSRLNTKHLPQDRKGVDGNNVGNAALRAVLTPEFFDPPNDAAEAND